MKSSLINWTFSCIDSKNGETVPPNDLRAEIGKIKELPPLPGVAAKIMQLAVDPLSDAAKLARIVEMDPLLTTQVIRWARSSMYGYKGKISSVQGAINQVLGYQFVFDLVLGLSALSPLKAPVEGVIGTRSFWTHALASTHLMSALNGQLPHEQRFDAQTVFFVALMHNIGFPLLGDQFRKEFEVLSSLVEANPCLSLPKLEKFAFGVNHCELGSWLLGTWNMPSAVIDIVYHHHNPNYKGDNYQLNLLTCLSDNLLGTIGIGDVCEEEVDCESLYSQLGIDPLKGALLLSKIADDIDDIKGMVDVCLKTEG